MAKHKLSTNQIEITYIVNAEIPFRWEPKVKDESIIKCVEKYIEKDENINTTTGKPVHINYVFEGLKRGKTTITFQYYNYIDEEEIYNIEVDSNKKITILKQ